MADPTLFMLGDTAGLTGLLLPPVSEAGAGSLILTALKPPFPFTFSLQAVIEDTSSASGFSVTNAVEVVVH